MDALEFGVIHSLRKVAHTSEAEVRLSERVLDVSNEAVLNLATQLAGLVGKSGSRVMWGQFSDDNRQGLFPGTVKDFSSELTQENFMSSSLTAMKELLNQAKEEPLSTGGHICFFAFRSRQKPFLLVAMVKERSGLTLSEDLVPTSIVEIDLSKLHQAARINLQTYLEQTSEQRGSAHGDINSSEPEAEVEVEVEEERAYLCFVDKGVGRSTVAGYFIRALGCERGVSSERATKAVIRAVRDFVKGNAEISTSAPYVRHKLIDYFSTKDDGSAITLEAVAEVVRGRSAQIKRFTQMVWSIT